VELTIAALWSRHTRLELELGSKDWIDQVSRALFKHLVDSSPHGEQLVFASLGRIEEQDEAVLKFNDTLRELLRRKGLS
jgi:hypothetical protein